MERAGEGGGLLLDGEIDLDDDGAVDVLVAEDGRFEAVAIEPLTHPRHLAGEFTAANPDLRTMKVHGDT